MSPRTRAGLFVFLPTAIVLTAANITTNHTLGIMLAFVAGVARLQQGWITPWA